MLLILQSILRQFLPTDIVKYSLISLTWSNGSFSSLSTAPDVPALSFVTIKPFDSINCWDTVYEGVLGLVARSELASGVNAGSLSALHCIYCLFCACALVLIAPHFYSSRDFIAFESSDSSAPCRRTVCVIQRHRQVYLYILRHRTFLRLRSRQ